jgi:hypothetical protein
LGVLVCLAVAAPVLSSGGNEAAIRATRARYAAVNRHGKRYTKVERELFGYSLGGGSLAGYFSGPALRKMVATFYGETGRAVEEYYFWNGRLFLVLRTRWHYDQPLGSQVLNRKPGTMAGKEQDRFYFQEGRLLRWLGRGNKPVASEAGEAARVQRDLSQSAQEFTALLGLRAPGTKAAK